MTEKEFKQQFVLMRMETRAWTGVLEAMDEAETVVERILRRDPNFFSETEASIREPQLQLPKDEKSYVREMNLNQFANMLPDVYATRFHSIINSFNNGAYNDNMKLNTVSDLLKIGKLGFLKLRHVGRKMLTVVDDTLERYGITDW